MKCDGEMSPCPGRRQRSSASAPTTRPSRRSSQLGFEHQAFDRRGIHLGQIERKRIAAVLLGVIHRRVGVADQIDDVLGIVGADCDADARGQVDLLLIDVEGAADLVEQGARERADAGSVVDLGGQVVDEHREFVARQTTDHRVLAEVAREPLAQDLERAVARRMPERVVDLLEPVEVEIQQCERASRLARTRDRLLQQVLELHAVRHLRERVVARQITDAPFRALALGDVARDVDIALELGVLGRDGRTGHRNRDGLAARRAQHRLARLRPRMHRIEAGAVRFVDESRERPAEEVRLGEPEQLLRRLVAAAHDAVGRGHEHGVGKTVEHGVQVILRDRGLAQLLAHALERELQIA